MAIVGCGESVHRVECKGGGTDVSIRPPLSSNLPTHPPPNQRVDKVHAWVWEVESTDTGRMADKG